MSGGCAEEHTKNLFSNTEASTPVEEKEGAELLGAKNYPEPFVLDTRANKW
jgi:hypothetical protein